MSKFTFQQAAAEFRQFLPDLSLPRFTKAKEQDCYSYAETLLCEKHPPWIYNLAQTWEKLYRQPFKGLTSDGKIIPDLYQIQDEGVDVEKIVKAVENALSNLSSVEKKKVSYPLNAREWRAWSNPEFLFRPFGVRLEDISEDAAQSILAVLEATFSPEGYQKALGSMRVNHFLGEICQVQKIMNKYSYNFLLFGTPSATDSWGWSLYGHHLCVNVFLRGKQIVIAPTFTGAEPNVIDDGPWIGTKILHEEGDLGLKLMQSLDQEKKEKARVYVELRDPKMLQTGDLEIDRWNHDDQRHLCGAFRDNRIVPYEGVLVSSFSSAQQQLVLDIAEEFLLYYPKTARDKKKELIRSHFGQTWFCWIGGYGDKDPFYFRIQSPVIVFEFDHHAGVFLTNSEPGRFHTHTIVRMPHEGDYGNALRDADDKLT